MNPVYAVVLLFTHLATLLISDFSIYGIKHFVVAVPLVVSWFSGTDKSLASHDIRSSFDQLLVRSFLPRHTVFNTHAFLSGLLAGGFRLGLLLVPCFGFMLLCLAIEKAIRRAHRSSEPPATLPLASRRKTEAVRREYYLYCIVGSSDHLRVRRAPCGATVAALDLAFRGTVRHSRHTVVPFYSLTGGWTTLAVEDLEVRKPRLTAATGKRHSVANVASNSGAESTDGVLAPREDFIEDSLSGSKQASPPIASAPLCIESSARPENTTAIFSNDELMGRTEKNADANTVVENGELCGITDSQALRPKRLMALPTSTTVFDSAPQEVGSRQLADQEHPSVHLDEPIPFPDVPPAHADCFSRQLRLTTPKAGSEDPFIVTKPDSVDGGETAARPTLPSSPCDEVPLEIDDFKAPESSSKPTPTRIPLYRGSSLVTRLGLQPPASIGLNFHFARPGAVGCARPFWQTMPPAAAQTAPSRIPISLRRASLPNLGLSGATGSRAGMGIILPVNVPCLAEKHAGSKLAATAHEGSPEHVAYFRSPAMSSEDNLLPSPALSANSQSKAELRVGQAHFHEGALL